MNTNTMELNLNEMENVNGGNKKNPLKREAARNISNWLSDTVAPALQAASDGTCFLGKAAVKWITGLFS